MIGTKLAHYEITSHLGTGGMGEVYQATDSKLGRSVAIKLLPAAFASDAERLSRFRREAQVLASLNHSNIAQIYGIEESVETRCIVMELVEGETLQARIKRGPISVKEALAIAKQIAEALEAAHEKGVVHRDLKPGNVMLTDDGNAVKVLDFGLAKASEVTSSNASLSKSPTMASMGATNAGMILGTAAYMSPEQAKGRTVDARTDVFAFGCVFYEMLSGQPAFGGDDVAEILSRVLQREPDWTLLPANVPLRVRELLRLCLEKNTKNRRQTATDVRIDIEQAQAGSPPSLDAVPARIRTSRVAWLVAAAAMLGVVGLAIPAMRHFQEKPPPELRVDINTPPTTDLLSMALSPDAQRIVFVARDGGQQKLWLRSMGSVESHALGGTDGASFPFWSPNSGSIGFFADGKLKRIDIAGGTVQAITSAAAGRGGTWNNEDTIVFAGSITSPLMRVSATGGQPVAVTRLQSQQNSHRFPRFLPDNRHFLYYVNIGPEAGVYIGSLDSETENPRLLSADGAAEFAASGHLLFVRQGTIFAQRFDLAGLKLMGDPFPVSEKVAVDPALGIAAVTASASGPIAFRGGAGAQQFLWFDRSGNEVGKVGEPDLDGPSSPELSPDGQRLALWRSVSSNGNSDIWIAEIERGLLSRFTVDESADIEPLWSPTGEIFFASNRKGLYNIYRKAVNGAGAEVAALVTTFSKRPLDISRDGRFLLYGSIEPQTAYDIWAFPLTGDQKPFPVADTTFEERDGQFSPNGNWVAYRSNESGRLEVYVQAFPGPGEKKQVSNNGGAQPRWSSDGKELFYIDLDGRLMAVSIRAGATGQPVETGIPAALFTTRIALATQRTVKHQYAVSRDGRFLINSFPKDAVASPITLILNWNPLQKK